MNTKIQLLSFFGALTLSASAATVQTLPYSAPNVRINGNAPITLNVEINSWGGNQFNVLQNLTTGTSTPPVDDPSNLYFRGINPSGTDILAAGANTFEAVIAFSTPIDIGHMAIKNGFQNNQYQVEFVFSGPGSVALQTQNNETFSAGAYTGVPGYAVTQTGTSFLFDSIPASFSTGAGDQGTLFRGIFDTAGLVSSIIVRGVRDTIWSDVVPFYRGAIDDIEFVFPAPEPGVTMLGALGCVGLLGRRRRA